MALALSADVETSLMRPLSPSESQYVDALLERAEGILVAKVPGLIDRAATDAQYRGLVVTTESGMVARVFRNPDGMKSESDGTYSYSIDWTVASGRLKALDDELSMLGVGSVGSLAGEMDGYARARYAHGNPSLAFQWGWPGIGSWADEL